MQQTIKYARTRVRFFAPLVLSIGLLMSGCSMLSGNPVIGEEITDSSNQSAALFGTVTDQASGLNILIGDAELQNVETGHVSHAQVRDGRLQFTDMTPGKYEIRVWAQHFHVYKTPIVLSDQTVASFELTDVYGPGERDLLARLIRSEAEGEPYEGQVAVASSVLNRVLHPDYPNSLREVIEQVIEANGIKYYQYEPVLNGTINYPATEVHRRAAADALRGEDPSYGATGFFAPDKVPCPRSWVCQRDLTRVIANHQFFQ